MNKSFSVIIPTYNRGSILPICIKALRDQVYAPELFEIIVVDNGSTDDTLQIVEKLNLELEQKVRYIFENNPGLMYARHAGTKMANGEILAYIDDDILVASDWLKQLDRAYQEFNADCAGGKIVIQWDRNPPEWVPYFEGVLGKLDLGPIPAILKPGQYIYGGNFSIRKDRLYQVGGFNPDQIDGNLVGDGEIGLCDKIHRMKLRMVWAPDAVVWHQQFVDRNGTLEDFKRRYANNGASSAYSLYLRHQWRKEHLLLRSISSQLKAFLEQLKAIFKNLLFNDSRVAKYRHLLNAELLRSQSHYFFRLIYDKNLQQVAKNQDWLDFTN